MLAIDRVVFAGPAGRRRRGRRAGHRRRGARPDRGRVRGAAGRGRPAQVDAARTRRASPTRAPRPTPARRWPTPASPSTKTEAATAKAANIAQQARLSRGDVGRGLRRGRPRHREHLPRADGPPGLHRAARGLAEWDRNGRLTIWASTQGSFNTRAEVADVLGIPENRIKVIPMECGGGFGGKIRALVEPITAVLLSQATGRPVRYVMTRREELEAGMPAPAASSSGSRPASSSDGTRWRSRPRRSSRPAPTRAPC